MRDATTLFEDDLLRVSTIRRDGPSTGRSLVTFTGVGHNLAGLDIQQPEFFKAGDDYESITFVIDRTRSWGNAVDFDKLSGLLDAVAGDTEIHLLGNSMGGFLALLAPSVLSVPVSDVLAIVPQFSVHPDIVPWEDRWPEYTDHITTWRYPSLEGHIVPDCDYTILTGGRPKDKRHLRMIPEADNVSKFIFSGFNHQLAANLKRRGKLQEGIALALAGAMSQDWVDSVAALPAQ